MINSTNNSKIKKTVKLLLKKYRNKENKFLIEGYHLVEEAKKLNIIIEVFTTNKNVKGTFVSKEVIKKLSSTKNPPPIVAVCKKINNTSIGNKVLALNNVQDPGNVGTLIRSAKAFGWDGVIVEKVDIYNSKVIRATQGALFSIPIIETNDISLYFKDYEVVGAILDKNAKNYKKYLPSNKLMLVLGNEANGISKNIKNKLHEKVYIPIEFESLNVASTGAILLNEYK